MLQTLYELERTLDGLLQYPYASVEVTPVLLTSHPEQRAQQKARLVELGEELEVTCLAIHRLEAQLQSLRRDVEYRHAAVVNALAPASAVPTEILREIFLHAVDGGRDDSFQTRIAVSHTSSYWRAVCLALPEFWQSIVLTALQAPLFETLRLRSYPLPMWLRVEDSPRPLRDGLLGRPESDNVELSEPMTNEFAAAQPSRLVSLRIEDTARFPFVRFFGDSVLPVTLDELQVFSSSQYPYTAAAMFSPRIIAARSLLFNRAWIDPLHFSVANLAKLSLVDLPYEAMGRLLSVASDCPVLEILHLESIRRKDQNPGPPVVLLMPWLSVDIRSLAIINCDEELWMQLLALPTFRLAKLTSFALHHGEEFMAVFGPTSEVFRAFLTGSPYLEHVSFSTRATDLPHILLSLITAAESIPAPAIRDLELIALGRGDDSWLLTASAQSVIRERSIDEHVQGAAALQRLAISQQMISGQEEWFQQAVGALTIIEEEPGEDEVYIGPSSEE